MHLRRRTAKRSWSRPCWPRSSPSSQPVSFLQSSIPRAVLDPDRCSHKTKSFPDLVLQKALVGEVQFDCAIGEQNERRRRHVGLSHVENLHALAHGHGGALEVDVLEEAIHFSGADALAAFPRNFLQ